MDSHAQRPRFGQATLTATRPGTASGFLVASPWARGGGLPTAGRESLVSGTMLFGCLTLPGVCHITSHQQSQCRGRTSVGRHLVPVLLSPAIEVPGAAAVAHRRHRPAGDCEDRASEREDRASQDWGNEQGDSQYRTTMYSQPGRSFTACSPCPPSEGGLCPVCHLSFADQPRSEARPKEARITIYSGPNSIRPSAPVHRSCELAVPRRPGTKGGTRLSGMSSHRPPCPLIDAVCPPDCWRQARAQEPGSVPARPPCEYSTVRVPILPCWVPVAIPRPTGSVASPAEEGTGYGMKRCARAPPPMSTGLSGLSSPFPPSHPIPHLQGGACARPAPQSRTHAHGRPKGRKKKDRDGYRGGCWAAGMGGACVLGSWEPPFH